VGDSTATIWSLPEELNLTLKEGRAEAQVRYHYDNRVSFLEIISNRPEVTVVSASSGESVRAYRIQVASTTDGVAYLEAIGNGQERPVHRLRVSWKVPPAIVTVPATLVLPPDSLPKCVDIFVRTSSHKIDWALQVKPLVPWITKIEQRGIDSERVLVRLFLNRENVPQDLEASVLSIKCGTEERLYRMNAIRRGSRT
jgi:hypothetical protein